MRLRKSLSFRVFISIFLALTLILGLSKLAFNYYASSFYYYSQMEKMEKAAYDIANLLGDSTNFSNELLQVANSIGGIISVRDNSGRLLYSSQLANHMPSEMHRSNQPRSMGHMRRVHDNVFFTNTPTGDYELLNYEYEFDDYIITASLATKFIDDSIEAVSTLYNYLLMASLLIALIISYFVAKKISSPLISLNNTAKELANLNLDARHNINREDEIGQLSQTFNEMAQRLQTTISRLEQELSKEKYSEQLRKNFVARASHELKTPLAIVKGYSEALADRIVTSELEVGEYTKIIDNEIDKASQMVSELLELSKLENPEYKFKKSSLELISFLKNLVSKYVNSKMSYGKELVFSPKVDHLLIEADETRLEQGFSNIIKNAIRFTKDSGKIEITINETNRDVTVNIYNEGPQIDNEHLGNIWDSFYTTDSGNNKSSGSGLGLAIAKQIFIRHDALYGATNNNNGVTFWVTLKKVGK